MKLLKTFVCFCFVSLLAWNAQAANSQQFDRTDPYVLLDGVAKVVFDRFNNEFDQIKTDPEQLKVIITDELLPHIDYVYAAFKVLGSNLKGMSREQKKQFAIAFKDYMITVYAQAFTNYRNTQRIQVEPSKSVGDAKLVVVKSKITEPGRPDIDIFFSLRKKKNKKTNQIVWQAYDMTAEGISVLNTKTTEINQAIKRNGVDAVIKDLKNKASKPLVLKSTGSKAE